MWLSFYNREGISDTLLLTAGMADRYEVVVQTKGSVTEIFDPKAKRAIGYNLADISEQLSFEKSGQQSLTAHQQAVVKEIIQTAGFSAETLDLASYETLVVGYVEECVPHQDSDHLRITQTRVSSDTVLQIVCGAPNVKAGQKVVVAMPGTVMPNGSIIWEGELRGVVSQGMLCSARELGIPQSTTKKGILVLDDDAVVGSPFSEI